MRRDPRVCRKKDDGNAVTEKEEKGENKKKIIKCSERRYGGSWCEGDGRSKLMVWRNMIHLMEEEDSQKSIF